METYTYSCPGCGAALEYDVASKKMFCKYCMEYYIPELLQPVEIKLGGSQDGIQAQSREPNYGVYSSLANESVNKGSSVEGTGNQGDENTMEIRIYSCGNCGAEIMTNDVEVSTFCSYCASPALMFDRISREQKPDKIIPFAFSKMEALTKAREKFSRAQFVGDALDDLTVDSVYGIYMPFWNFHTVVGMDMEVRLKYATKYSTTEPRYFTETMERDVLVDASRSFSDDVAACLLPYKMNEARPFSSTYLSGSYGDRKDDNQKIKEDDAKNKLEDLLVDVILDKNSDIPKAEVRKQYELNARSYMLNYTYDITREVGSVTASEYLFLPVYFITFKIMGERVIVLVNGQTGKVVGNIPINQELFKKKQMKDTIVCAIIFGVIGFFIFGFLDVIWGVFFLGILGGTTVLSGRKENKDYKTRYAQTNADSMFALTKRKGY